MKVYKVRFNDAHKGPWEYFDLTRCACPAETYFERVAWERHYSDSPYYKGFEFKPVPEVQIPVKFLLKGIKSFTERIVILTLKREKERAKKKVYTDMLKKRQG